ncbi:hypothetical protein GGTG_09057 [Gaeumannomyces tritici R3-111a-1]|uniref:DHHA2 domain-containing protein n=1 Tax=Gaeumannomyces tritici (strain R3-111a-1) TaxID=644352 RepID=J3P6B6_GAET3|nr:hypothetical protein GGTG_09057 [Gaeumannomyces tritici R3-111a-1]EJT72190.1 hypothetical protein GGTG_09057 [Gaeumannomyces tritici R3-111a-1]
MRPIQLLGAAAVLAAAPAAAANSPQRVLVQPDATLPTERAIETGVGHFSEWSRETKRQFLIDWQRGRSSEWTIVMGNEGGDLDSMAAALTWAYHLEHSTANSSSRIKAIALLQTPADALDLRPENKLALDNSQMSSGHSDLLTMNELPEDAETLSKDIKGIVIVDHASPLRKWADARVLSIFDHHQDKGTAPAAKPRVFEKVASCTTLVARQMLDELEALPDEYHMPHELLELVLSAIAIDSKGLKSGTDEDRKTAGRLLRRSNWRKSDLDDKMQSLDGKLGEAKKDLGELGVRDLLRRDWKGDLVDTYSPRTPTVSLGFSSIPYSLDEQITRTGFGELFDWFAIEAAWTAQVGADISVALNRYKGEDENGKKKKIRELVLCVRSDVRINNNQADDLFDTVKRAIESHPELQAKPWHRVSELGRRQMVWTYEGKNAGRKIIRPIVEAAVEAWDMAVEL